MASRSTKTTTTTTTTISSTAAPAAASMFEIVKQRVQSKPDNVPLSKIRDEPDKPPYSSNVCLGCNKKQSATPNTPFSSCSRCNGVKYCCRDCQVKDWKGKGEGPTKPQKHKDICPIISQSIKEFDTHPTAGSIVLRKEVFKSWADQHNSKDGTFHLHEFLARKHLLGNGSDVGFWAVPDVLTPYHTSGSDQHGFYNGQMMLYKENFPTMEEGWTTNLSPNERIDVTKPPPTTDTNKLSGQGGGGGAKMGGVILQSWKDYLIWRELSPSSIAPLLMTNVLTIYQMIQHELQLPALPTKSYRIYLLGVETELNQIPLLQELLYLLPSGLDLEFILVSPAVKSLCDYHHHQIQLQQQQAEGEGGGGGGDTRNSSSNCLLSREYVWDVSYNDENNQPSSSSRLRVKLHKDHGLYEDIPYDQTATATAVLGLNVGLASYGQTWAPAMHKILRQGIPFCFSDQTKLIHHFVKTQWLPNVVKTCNNAFVPKGYEPLEVPPDDLLTIKLNPFHGIIGRDVSYILAPNLSNGYLLTGFPV